MSKTVRPQFTEEQSKELYKILEHTLKHAVEDLSKLPGDLMGIEEDYSKLKEAEAKRSGGLDIGDLLLSSIAEGLYKDFISSHARRTEQLKGIIEVLTPTLQELTSEMRFSEVELPEPIKCKDFH